MRSFTESIGLRRGTNKSLIVDNDEENCKFVVTYFLVSRASESQLSMDSPVALFFRLNLLVAVVASTVIWVVSVPFS